MTGLANDLTNAVRRLRQSPGLAIAAIASISLGIAANTTIFSMVSTFLLRPPPVGDPSSLMAVRTTQREQCCNDFSWPLVRDLREQAASFSGVAAYYPLLPASTGGAGEPERVWGQAATTNFFDVAGVVPVLGRGFESEENALPVIVLANGLWRRAFGADPAIAGKSILLSGQSFTVVGVAPPDFRGLDSTLNAEFWVPLGEMDRLLPRTADFESRGNSWLPVVARRKPGVTTEQAVAELDAFGRRLTKNFPYAEKDRGFRLAPAGAMAPRFRGTVAAFLGGLTAAALLVLGIACANVANLLLAQASSRRKEMAVRLALGATRGRLMRQMLTESTVLAAGGGLCGLVLSWWATRGLSHFRLPVPVPLRLGVEVDWRALAFTAAICIGTGVLVGVLPAWAASRPILAAALKGEELVVQARRRWTFRDALVVFQIAVSLVLLCGTGLFLRSLQSAGSIDVGFRSNGVLKLSVDPQVHGYTAERTRQFLDTLRGRVSGLPGVRCAAWTDLAPLSMGGRRDDFRVEGRPDSEPAVAVDLYMVTEGYFETLGIPRVSGRDFRAESAASPRVAVVNEALARRLFPAGDPVGQRVAGAGLTYEIIGVVGNMKSRTPGERAVPVLYRSLLQEVGGEASFMGYTLLVRSDGDPGAATAAVRSAIRSSDPSMAVFNVETMAAHVHDALFLPRLAGAIFGVLGGSGLLLAVVGLYGVMSYAVSRRTREIGIRLALGAQVGAVQRLVIGHGMRLTLVAVPIGLAIALAASTLAESLLYGIRPHDVATFTGVPLLLVGVALVACWIPSRRAAGVDPLTALRHE